MYGSGPECHDTFRRLRAHSTAMVRTVATTGRMSQMWSWRGAALTMTSAHTASPAARRMGLNQPLTAVERRTEIFAKAAVLCRVARNAA